jgi:Heterokaryon incompatibility protein (HET)
MVRLRKGGCALLRHYAGKISSSGTLLDYSFTSRSPSDEIAAHKVRVGMSTNKDPPSAPLYEETSLDQPSFSVRLLRIRSSGSGGIDWGLEVHVLAYCHQYIALSYMWGDEEARCKIQLNGHEVQIRSNLYQALTLISTEMIKSHKGWCPPARQRYSLGSH